MNLRNGIKSLISQTCLHLTDIRYVENHDRKSGSTVERQIQIINIDVALLETEKQFVQITNLILYLDSKNITKLTDKTSLCQRL